MSQPKGQKYLYKYQRIDGNNLDFSRNIFTKNELYFRTATAFNDPFDCKFQVELRASNEDPDLPKKVQNTMIEEIRRQYGICCLSEVRDDILMWAHYADAHRGFCLQFWNPGEPPFAARKLKPDGSPEEIPRLWQVEYFNEYPSVDPVDDEAETLAKKTVCTKAKQWEYEKEWRMVDPNGPGPHQFPPPFLTGVIFGCRMLKKYKQMIRDWCKDRETLVKYYEAQLSDDSYSLEIVQVS